MRWKDSSPKEKLLQVARLLISVIVMIAAALQLFNIWPDGLRLAIPLLGVLQILQAVLLWNKKRDQAASFLFVGFFIGIVCIIVFGV